MKVLEKARECEGRRDWPGAAQHFEQALREGDGSAESVYARLARCYRMSSHRRLADEVIERGLDANPSSEMLLMEKFRLDTSVRRWLTAKRTAEALLDLKPSQSSSYFRLGRMHVWLGQTVDAEKSYITGLEMHQGVPLDDIIAEVRGRIRKQNAFDNSTMTSSYGLTEGKNNLGFFWHQQEDRQYITKIMLQGKNCNREVSFYRSLRPTSTALMSLSPEYVDFHEIEGITYLTLEVASGEGADSRFVGEMIESVETLSSVPYKTVAEYPGWGYTYELRKAPLALFGFFSEIDQRDYNERLFDALRSVVKHNEYPPYVMKVVSDLEALILDNRLYMFVVRNLHFSLVHGDLCRDNVKVDQRSGIVTIFDWASFTSGPRFMDLARWFAASKSRVPYEVVQREYLAGDGLSEQPSTIEKIFFLYAYVLLHLLETYTDEEYIKTDAEFIKEDLDERMPEFIEPALDDLRVLVALFNEDRDAQLELLKSRYTEEDQRRGRLERVLENERAAVARIEKNLTSSDGVRTKLQKRLGSSLRMRAESEKQLAEMLESGSWKLTAPLRGFSKRMKSLIRLTKVTKEE